MGVLLFVGCQSPSQIQQPIAPATPSQPPPQGAVWRIAERPFSDSNFSMSCGQGSCFFRTTGLWKSSTGKPGSELAEPVGVTIECEKAQKHCLEIDASVNGAGFLESDEIDYRVSLWSEDQIIGSNVGGLCRIGRQLVIDLPGKMTITRTYPTTETSGANDPCAVFNTRDSYVLHGGHWQLQPVAPKAID